MQVNESINPKVLLAPEGFKNHWREDVSIEEYHGDRKSVSSSSLKKVVMVSPKTFYHTFFIADEGEKSESMELGRLAHMAILEGAKFKDRYVVEPEFWGYTQKGERTNSANCKEVKEQRAAWLRDLPPGTIVTTPKQRDKILGMIDSLLSHSRANEFLSAGIAECSGYYVDPKTGILCRIRPDFMCRERRIITDLKTAEDPREEAFRWQIYGDRYPLWYDFSMAMYCEGFERIEQKKVEIAAWIAIGSKAPHEVAVHAVTIPVSEIGLIKYRRALDRLRESIDTNVWPGIQGPQDVSFIVPTDKMLEDYGVNYDTEALV